MTASPMSTLLAIPQELRDEIFNHLTIPGIVYTSSAEADTYALHRVGSRKTEETYVDTRIFLPSHPPANILATCRQLRKECLEHHSHLLNSSTVTNFDNYSRGTGTANSTKVAERSGTEFDEAVERYSDDGVTLRLTLEVQRGQRGPFGFSVPTREDMSPRFLALLPLIRTARRLKLVVWPGFDWWNGPPQISLLDQWRHRKALLKRINAFQIGHTEQPSQAETTNTSSASTKIDALSVAVGKILDYLPAVEVLDLNVLIETGDLFRWDLPDVKWERIQPWLDGPITRTGGVQLRQVSRTLTSVWQMPDCVHPREQRFYVQSETRSNASSNRWHVQRQGGLRAPMFEHLAQLAALELPETSVNETFEREDS